MFEGWGVGVLCVSVVRLWFVVRFLGLRVVCLCVVYLGTMVHDELYYHLRLGVCLSVVCV